MPIVIEDTTNIQQKFFKSLMETSNSLALSQLWLFGIDIQHLQSIQSYIEQNFNMYEGNTENWDIFQDSQNTIKTSWFIGDTYYILAQSAVFPGDSLSVSRVGVERTGVLKGLIGEMRNDLQNVTITFLETNQSIADLFFRPWTIMVGHKSLKFQQLRKPIKLVCFQKSGTTSPLKIRKIIELQASAPINIDSEEYNYTGDKVIQRQIEFVYNRYKITANAGVSTGQTTNSADYLTLSTLLQSSHSTNPNNPSSEQSIFVVDENSFDIRTLSPQNDPEIPVQETSDISTTQLNQSREILKTINSSYKDILNKTEKYNNKIEQTVKNKSTDEQYKASDTTLKKSQDKIIKTAEIIGTGEKYSKTIKYQPDIKPDIKKK